jgi:enamine deaminase RidA (YjgF/YER057c/UK114 family)
VYKKILVSSGAVWEDKVGYSRAVRVGNIIEVSGTTAVDKDEIVSPSDVYGQTKFIIGKIEKAIDDAGGTLQDVVRTRIYVTDISKWELVGKAHGEYFGSIKPATSMVEVKSLIDPDLLVEIEATAIVTDK